MENQGVTRPLRWLNLVVLVLGVLGAAGEILGFSGICNADDAVAIAFRQAAAQLDHLPPGAPRAGLLRQTVTPALDAQARRYRAISESQRGSWHIHGPAGEDRGPQVHPAPPPEETVLSGEGVPQTLEFAGGKRSKASGK